LTDLSVFVCTYNSSSTLDGCLASIRRAAPKSRLVIIDHMSSDGTIDIADRYDALIRSEDVGLGYARQMAFELADTEFLAFVDSDVEIVRPGFFQRAVDAFRTGSVGAVVGMAVGHRLAYGLPASLLVLRTRDFRGKVIPDYIDARETYFIQERLDSSGLTTMYLADTIVHKSQYRKFKPEWEGANTRMACGIRPSQLTFSLKVILLMSINSKSVRNMVYTPVFYLKFLRGYANPGPWVKLDRKSEARAFG
jgi:glycosyltransferase involved in cell wall biosynthesis